jgi:hypothetical protein
MLSEVRGGRLGEWADRLVRAFLFVYLVLAFPTGYVIYEAAAGSAAARAMLADPRAFLAARSQGARGAVPFATTKPALAKRTTPPARKPDPDLLPPDSEAFLPPASMLPDVAFNPSPFPGGPDFDLAGPLGSVPMPDDPASVPRAWVPVDDNPRLAVVPPLNPPAPPNPQTTVPEPATWLIMVVGFLMTGFVLRLRTNAIGRKV